MNLWGGFSLEFRAWMRDALVILGRASLPGVAMLSPDRTRVICSEAPLHPEDAPCRRCERAPQCPAAASASPEPRWPPDWPQWDSPPADGMPGFTLVALGPVQSQTRGVPEAGLSGLGQLFAQTWRSWDFQERRRDSMAGTLAMAESICKLASRRVSESEVARQLDHALKGACQAQSWAILLLEPSGTKLLVHSKGSHPPAALSEIGTALWTFPEIQMGDVLVLHRYPDQAQVAARIARLLRREPVPELPNLVVLPLATEARQADQTPQRLHLLLVLLAHEAHPPGPVFDRMRLLCQLALPAWECARRLAEAQAKENQVREEIRVLPGFEKLVGQTQVMSDLRVAVLRAARSDRTVLLIGEPGTGKEVVAKLIHERSAQADARSLCGRVADALRHGLDLWKTFYPSEKTLAEIVAREFRDVSCVRPADLSKDHESWRPDDPELAAVLVAEEKKLHPAHRYLYHCLLRRLLPARQENPLFNFFEYDSGAAAKEHIASELFGYPDKRFTDAEGGPGRFQTASHCGGTLFLDNIHHLDLAVQKALLKATEIEHEHRRVTRANTAGSEPVFVRLIAASTVDLWTLVEQGKFLGELASRLTCEVIRVPPLEDRREDIPLLAAHFASQHAKRLEEPALAQLLKVSWTGKNVRGLQAVIHSASSKTDRHLIQEADIAAALFDHRLSIAPKPLNDEQVMIRNALRQAGGNVSHAARTIGWSRQKLHRLMQQYGINRHQM